MKSTIGLKLSSFEFRLVSFQLEGNGADTLYHFRECCFYCSLDYGFYPLLTGAASFLSGGIAPGL
jgi:hypothetical protein